MHARRGGRPSVHHSRTSCSCLQEPASQELGATLLSDDGDGCPRSPRLENWVGPFTVFLGPVTRWSAATSSRGYDSGLWSERHSLTKHGMTPENVNPSLHQQSCSRVSHRAPSRPIGHRHVVSKRSHRDRPPVAPYDRVLIILGSEHFCVRPPRATGKTRAVQRRRRFSYD